MPEIGRNEPCHCGSGKKYKHCCMQIDEESRRTKPVDDESEPVPDEDLSESPPPAMPGRAVKHEEPPEPSDPLIEAIDARWDEFEAQDYEGQIALFLKTLDEPESIDDEMAFEMLDKIHERTVKHHEPYRYDALVDQLRERLPEVYSKNAQFYLQNCIENAVMAGDFNRVKILFNELVQRADKDIDVFNDVVDQLAYHGQLSTLVDAHRIAWPAVKESVHIVPWGIDQFAGHAVQLLIFDYFERHGVDPCGHKELFECLNAYGAIEPDRIERSLTLLAGKSGRQWKREDFTFKPKHRRSRDKHDDDGIQIPDKVQQNLFDLSLEFQGHLRREQNLPFAKSELGREQLVRYLVERLAGRLEPRKSMFEAVVYPNKPGPKKRSPEFYLAADDGSVVWLCPDNKTINLFLAQLLDFMSSQPYKAVAMFELIPAWLDCLNTHQLITSDLREKALLDLKSLRGDLRAILRKTHPDPALQAAVAD